MVYNIGMYQYLINKIKNLKFTLRFCVIFILISFFVIALSINLPIIYYRLQDDSDKVSFQFMSQISSQVYFRVKEEINNVEVASKFSEDLIKSRVVDPKNKNELLDYFITLMKVETQTLESVQSVFWGDEVGNFVMAEKRVDGTFITEVINRNVVPSIRTLIHSDASGKVLHNELMRDFKYDPRIRPWYITAKTNKKPSWTEIYPFRLTGFLGTTYTVPIFSNSNQLEGVFILNIRVDFLRRFIENIDVSPNGKVFVVQDDGLVIAYPQLDQEKTLTTLASLNVPWLTKAFEEFKQIKQSQFSYQYDGQKYLTVFKPIAKFGSHVWYVGVVAPQNDFVGSFEQGDQITIFITLLILMLGIVLVYFFIQRVMSPVKSLIKETEKIKNFELENQPKIHSRIKEIFQLSVAIESMKNGLRSFQKYVPASLVRQLIETGEDVRLGGVRKKLAIFFSDIKDFTRISERTDPDKLMNHICEYFEELTHIIIKDRGTIDKYIGDSIMAIWGAPINELHACEQAAKAALECEQCLTRLNKKWESEGKAIFITRIGLHTGEAIVGNVGSSERLSYTAIGDSINMASRLEGLNKMYGTKILVSEDFYNTVKNQFIFRKVDNVTLKGKEDVTSVYELLCERREELDFDIDIYRENFEKAFSLYQKSSWNEAILQFKDCLNIFPQDTLAKVFIKRCENFKLKSPKLWDGVWHINKK